MAYIEWDRPHISFPPFEDKAPEGAFVFQGFSSPRRMYFRRVNSREHFDEIVAHGSVTLILDSRDEAVQMRNRILDAGRSVGLEIRSGITDFVAPGFARKRRHILLMTDANFVEATA